MERVWFGKDSERLMWGQRYLAGLFIWVGSQVFLFVFQDGNGNICTRNVYKLIRDIIQRQGHALDDFV